MTNKIINITEKQYKTLLEYYESERSVFRKNISSYINNFMAHLLCLAINKLYGYTNNNDHWKNECCTFLFNIIKETISTMKVQQEIIDISSEFNKYSNINNFFSLIKKKLSEEKFIDENINLEDEDFPYHVYYGMEEVIEEIPSIIEFITPLKVEFRKSKNINGNEIISFINELWNRLYGEL